MTDQISVLLAELALKSSLFLRRGVRREVRLKVSPSDCTPWAWGAMRPVIVLPDGFARLPAESRQNAIEHEISHIARLDFLTALLGCVCCALYWFQPLAWLALRRMKRESECACDDRVLLAGGCRTTYAAQLLDIAKTIHQKSARPILGTAMAGRTAISRRITSILDLDKRRSTVTRMKTAWTLIVTLALVVPLAALKSQAAAAPEANDLADPEFQALVQKGPADSDELALIVRTYAAHDRPADTIGVLVDYISRNHTRLVTPGVTTVIDSDNNMLALYTRAPDYPPEALAERREADVVLEFTISEYGRTRDVRVVSSSDSTFNDAAVDALSEFLYAPRLVDGVPVEMSGVRTTIRFKLM